MLSKLNSDFFFQPKSSLEFHAFEKKTGKLGAWVELGRLEVRDVRSVS